MQEVGAKSNHCDRGHRMEQEHFQEISFEHFKGVIVRWSKLKESWIKLKKAD